MKIHTPKEVTSAVWDSLMDAPIKLKVIVISCLLLTMIPGAQAAARDYEARNPQ